jgi:thiol-disulfide isomerase/thioredoxin
VSARPDAGGRSPTPLPSFPFGPGRGPLSRRARVVSAGVLAVCLVAVVVVGAVLATQPVRSPLRAVTIPAADRAASPALLRAAEAVGFEPRTEPSAGGPVEDDPLTSASAPAAAGLLAVGTLAPAFALRTATGVRVSLSAYRGRTLLLEFFATWCPHCDAEAPHLESLSRSLPAGRYAFLAVNADGETAPSVLAYHIYFGLGFPALLDPSSRPGSFSNPGGRGAVTVAYRVRSIPTFYVVAPDGRIAWDAQGEQPDLRLRAELERAGGR